MIYKYKCTWVDSKRSGFAILNTETIYIIHKNGLEKANG